MSVVAFKDEQVRLRSAAVVDGATGQSRQRAVVREYFRRASETWGDRYARRAGKMSDLDLQLRQRRAAEWLRPHLCAPPRDGDSCGPSRRLLDVGCGAGNLLASLADTGAELHGVDISDEMIAVAGHSLPSAKLRVAPAEQLPYADHVFHAASCLGVLEYLEDPAAALRALRRVLRPDGVLVVSFPNRASLLRRLSRVESWIEDAFGSLRRGRWPARREGYAHAARTLAEARDALRHAGFTVEAVHLQTYGLWGALGRTRACLRASEWLSREWSSPTGWRQRLACTILILARPVEAPGPSSEVGAS